MVNTERNIHQIMILDQGIIQFNAKPKDGIAFLVKNKVISEDPLDIAKFLATTDKLDKHVLGNFLGKDNDFSIAILNMFASLFHYDGVPFDLALRAFTSRFAMPGESQMIYRVLERFSVYYSSVNTQFDKDKALILSYALIMLNVDLHSARVKIRMTKEEFVRNTQPALGGAVGRSELEEMYTRILAKELKPETSAEEIVYSKLAVNPKYLKQDGPQAASSESIIAILKKGAFLLKFGREGNPHPRKVFLSADGKKLCWIDPKKLEKMQRKYDKQQRSVDSDGAECHSCLSQPKMPRFQRPLDELLKGKAGNVASHTVCTQPEGSSLEDPQSNCHTVCTQPEGSDPPSKQPEGSAVVSPVHAHLSEDPNQSTHQGLQESLPSPNQSTDNGQPESLPNHSTHNGLSSHHDHANMRESHDQGVNSNSVLVQPNQVPVDGASQRINVVEANQPSPVVEANHPVPVVKENRPIHPVPVVETNQPIQPVPVVEASQPIQPVPVVEASQPIHPVAVVKENRPIQANILLIPPVQSMIVVPPSLDILRSTFIKLRSRKPVSPDSFLREIPLEDVTGLVVGSGGTGNLRRYFSRQVDVDAETEQRCFSIITDYRTLDLQAPTNVDIGPWLHFFHSVLSDREKRLRAASDKTKDIWTFTQKERASLVRWQEIVPEWSAHWNCGARVAAGGGYRASQHPKEELLNHRMFLVNPSGFVLDRGQRLETAISPQLVALWLEGIPSSVRPRVWPIAAGNHLRIDEKFFAFLTDQQRDSSSLERELKSSSMRKLCVRALSWIDARGSREQQAFFKPQSLHKSFSMEQPQLSLDEESDASSVDSFDEGSGPMLNVMGATRVVVSAFLTHRTDIKYSQGMAQLAAMVILNVGIQDLHRAYSVYANLLHQHYFLDFFTMRWRDMRMRSDLFAKLMRERMPYLEDHFSAIQITSDLYFNQWMLTGFTRVLPFRTACRVWDGFLLLGESFFFTSALALLNYYEHALMTSGFSGCLEILLGHTDEVLFNDKKFFECVHYQSVSNERFAAWISAQRLAEEKTALYDLLLLM